LTEKGALSQERPFAGVSVLDFTWGVAGPLTTKYLADYGATVVRVESPSRPCGLRVSPPFKDDVPGVDRAGYFAFYNANKYSLSLDMNHPASLEFAARLVAWADVVAESYSPGTMERWGLGYESLQKIKPDIIMLRSSSQGQDGPHASFSAFGIPLVGLAGFSHFTGWPDGGCLPLPSAYTDLISPRFAAAAVVSALDYRRRTGRGQCLDCSQFEAGVHFLATAMLDYTHNGRQGGRQGNSHPYACPHGVFRCSGEDNWCAIAVFDERQWAALCQVCNPEWREDVRFSRLLDRRRNEKDLKRLIEEWTVVRTAGEVMERLQAVGVPSGAVANARDLREDPQLKHRGYFWTLEHPVLGAFPHAGQAAIMSETPARPRSAAPCLGEHTEFVCTQLLGMTDTEFLELFQAGVFG